jgi:transposase
MPCFAGLDISLKTTNICVLGENGDTLGEGKVATEPDDIIRFLRTERQRYRRIVLEAGSTARWLHGALTKAGLPVILVETRHAHGILKAGRNKTDRNDARGLAQMARVGLYVPVLVKSREAQQRQALMKARQLLVSKAADIERSVRGILGGFGLKLGVVSELRFQEKVTMLIGRQEWLQMAIRPLLRARNVMREQARYIELELVDYAKSDPLCRRLMTAPGVGPIVALTYTVAIDEPLRFRRARSVAAHLGLTQRVEQSGELVRHGRISGWGDSGARRALFMAARAILNPRTRPTALRSWGLQVAARRGRLKGLVAVARRLAVILYRMWIDKTDFREGEAAA